MALLRKRSSDVIDFLKLEREGTLDRVRKINNSTKNENNSDVIDFTSKKDRDESFQNSAGDFLSSLANAGLSNSDGNSGFIDGNEKDSHSKNLRGARLNFQGELNQMRIKIEDVEYKIERFLERLEKIESKFD